MRAHSAWLAESARARPGFAASKNAKGGDGWYDGDAFLLELADSKISKTDERVKACLVEYVRLSREEKKGTNDKFEKDYASLLAEYLKKYEKQPEKK